MAKCAIMTKKQVCIPCTAKNSSFEKKKMYLKICRADRIVSMSHPDNNKCRDHMLTSLMHTFTYSIALYSTTSIHLFPLVGEIRVELGSFMARVLIHRFQIHCFRFANLFGYLAILAQGRIQSALDSVY